MTLAAEMLERFYEVWLIPMMMVFVTVVLVGGMALYAVYLFQQWERFHYGEELEHSDS